VTDCLQPGADCGLPPVVDMGAYESQDGTASEIRFGDIDGDGIVGIAACVNMTQDPGPLR
jgi:hypothetical protein